MEKYGGRKKEEGRGRCVKNGKFEVFVAGRGRFGGANLVAHRPLDYICKRDGPAR